MDKINILEKKSNNTKNRINKKFIKKIRIIEKYYVNEYDDYIT